jgi:hypothetical protein
METLRDRMSRLRGEVARRHAEKPTDGTWSALAMLNKADMADEQFRLQVLAAHERALADMTELEMIRRRNLLRTRPADLPARGGTTPSTPPSTPTSPGGPGERAV